MTEPDLPSRERQRAPDDLDPGVTLVELLAWLGDVLSAYQDRIADEAALETRRRLGYLKYHVLSDADLVVTVDGALWRPIGAGFEPAEGDRSYVAETDADGVTTIRFGNGQTGALPPAGSDVTATYRTGNGHRLTGTVRWPPDPWALTVRFTASGLRFEPTPCAEGS
jgi:hypothetical protein